MYLRIFYWIAAYTQLAALDAYFKAMVHKYRKRELIIHISTSIGQ